MTNSFILVVTLAKVDILLSLLKQRFAHLDRALEGAPALVLEGNPVTLSRRQSLADGALLSHF